MYMYVGKTKTRYDTHLHLKGHGTDKKDTKNNTDKKNDCSEREPPHFILGNNEILDT